MSTRFGTVGTNILPVVIYLSSERFEDNVVMEDPKKTEPNASEDYENKHSDEKNLDRDGGERQPTDHKQAPSK